VTSFLEDHTDYSMLLITQELTLQVYVPQNITVPQNTSFFISLIKFEGYMLYVYSVEIVDGEQGESGNYDDGDVNIRSMSEIAINAVQNNVMEIDEGVSTLERNYLQKRAIMVSATNIRANHVLTCRCDICPLYPVRFFFVQIKILDLFTVMLLPQAVHITVVTVFFFTLFYTFRFYFSVIQRITICPTC
jgi:hypothetical protein